MRAENWKKEELEIEGWPVTITSYTIGKSSITEIATTSSGANVARCVADTPEASREEAFSAATRRLLRTRRLPTMVGG
jgi:hypothetical protein